MLRLLTVLMSVLQLFDDAQEAVWEPFLLDDRAGGQDLGG